MKNLILLAWVFISTQVLAQDPQLFEDTWYLQKLTINDMEILPPNNNPVVTEHIFNEAASIFATGYCDTLICELTYNDTNNSFDIIDILELGQFCVNPDDNAFHDLYYHYFTDPGVIIFNPFLYEITLDNSVRFLSIINSNGDLALNSNQLLNNNEQELESVVLYPNPVKNELSIKTVAIIERLEIYSIMGQLVKQQTLFTDKVSFNTEDLIVGVYFVKITTNEGLVSTRKIVKE